MTLESPVEAEALRLRVERDLTIAEFDEVLEREASTVLRIRKTGGLLSGSRCVSRTYFGAFVFAWARLLLGGPSASVTSPPGGRKASWEALGPQASLNPS